MGISLLKIGKIAGLIFIGILLGVIIAGKANLRIAGVQSQANVQITGCSRLDTLLACCTRLGGAWHIDLGGGSWCEFHPPVHRGSNGGSVADPESTVGDMMDASENFPGIAK